MCFGAKRAYGIALSAAKNGNCTVLGQLLHNPTVSQRLAEQGLMQVSTPQEIQTKCVLITAHGAPRSLYNQLTQNGLEILDATCPKVKKVQNLAMYFHAEGYHVILIAKKDHPESKGVAGNLPTCTVLREVSEITSIPLAPKYAVLVQTTENLQRVQTLLAQIRNTFPKSEIVFENTLCDATRVRQTEALKLAQNSSVMVVIGGKNSHNTLQLLNTCKTACPHTYLVETVQDIDPKLFKEDDVVGIVAGASTPSQDIDAIEDYLRSIVPQSITQNSSL